MRFVRFGPAGDEIPAVLAGDGSYLDIRPIADDIDGAFLSDGGVDRVRDAMASGRLPAFDPNGARIGPPIARPSAVLCIGMNYAAHAAESGSAPPESPVMFYKAPNTVVGPNDEVLLPPGSEKTDWEVELAVVIGRRARYLATPEQAKQHIAGYAIANDVSERTLQLELSGGQWSKGKSCETFNPLGPWLVTADELPDPPHLGLRSWVNGEPRQDSTTRDMIFDVYTLIHQLSQVTVLEPGDVINTGTPEGVALSGRFPYLRNGDVMELEIDRLGRQRQQVRAA
jgi:2-keto-4-pentenoate hydratase/2-oxohepta-3-ene-1,7-dioic acid hydratase in catechol pathway